MSEVDYLCVLLVEDHDDDADLIRAILTKCRHIKFVVEQVRTVAEAQDKLNRETYDIVLLDSELGEKTGFDLVSTLDRNDLFAPPIIMVTNCESREVDLRAQEAGLDDFLIMDDLNPALLERSIRFALERKDNEQRLQWMAYYDQLTELPNRARFNKELVERIEKAAAAGATFPCCCWTWTTSRTSTTPWGIPSATNCCRWWRSGFRPAPTRVSSRPAWAATSS
jgi:PleD family two-component response regulator